VSGLHRKRAENRSIGVGTPQSVSHNRDLRATLDQPHHSAVGKIGPSCCRIERCRGMVSGATQGKRPQESETISRSNHRQDPTRNEPGLQARAAVQFPTESAGRQPHALGKPADHERLLGNRHDAQAGVRGPSEHLRAETNVDFERRCDGPSSVRIARLDVDGSRLRERTKYAKENDFLFPSIKLKGRKPLSASVMVQKYLRPAGGSEGRSDQGRGEGAFRLS